MSKDFAALGHSIHECRVGVSLVLLPPMCITEVFILTKHSLSTSHSIATFLFENFPYKNGFSIRVWVTKSLRVSLLWMSMIINFPQKASWERPKVLWLQNPCASKAQFSSYYDPWILIHLPSSVLRTKSILMHYIQ